MEDRQPAVRIFVHAHHGAHKMRAQRPGRDLQSEPPPFDGVAVADPALLLDWQSRDILIGRLQGRIPSVWLAHKMYGRREVIALLFQSVFRFDADGLGFQLFGRFQSCLPDPWSPSTFCKFPIPLRALP
jgi:hypothetical protein